MVDGRRIAATIQLTDSERRLWIHNDAELWRWWRESSARLDEFVRDNGSEIDRRVAGLVNG